MAYTRDQLVNYLYQVADTYGIDRSIAYWQIERESRFNPEAVSPAGATGIAQFMPATAARFGLKNPRDPIASLDAWGAYMSELLQIFGWRYDLALAGYNSGENRNEYYAASSEGRPINWAVMPAGVQRETRPYVENILARAGAGSPDPQTVAGSAQTAAAAAAPARDSVTTYIVIGAVLLVALIAFDN